MMFWHARVLLSTESYQCHSHGAYLLDRLKYRIGYVRFLFSRVPEAANINCGESRVERETQAREISAVLLGKRELLSQHSFYVLLAPKVILFLGLLHGHQ